MVLFLLAAARALAYSIRASLVRAGIGLIALADYVSSSCFKSLGRISSFFSF